ncbi:MAG TPA: chemotaxis protein CheA [Aliidongia sp.]|uniref:chemotaxis protein CheA n=1 Tax=Aliidongia sp. TaxID=1914230 RepID=UPI002DDD0E6B|nr:chemotaxis protein CheA [Aliidongia sp.]HEV2673787.1 chemotaxis protein CheA [Aliidongia sp.]
MENLNDQFLAEGRELVQSAGDDLVALAARPDDPDRIDAVFRAVHTLKGSTGLFDLRPFGDMLHVAEDLLGALRRKAIVPDAGIIDLLVDCIDQASRWLDAFDAAGSLPADAAQVGRRLQDDIRRLMDPTAPDEPARTEATAVDRSWVDAILDAHPAIPQGDLVAVRYAPREDCFFTGDDPLALVKAIPGLCALSIGARQPWGALDEFDPFRCNLVFDAVSTAPRADVQAALRLVFDQIDLVEIDNSRERHQAASTATREVSARTLRVEVDSIDALGAIADDIVIANNALAHLAAQARGGTAGAVLVQGILANQLTLDRLVGSLHRAVTRIRLMPLSSLFQRFPRLLREIGAKLGKDVALVIDGETIEVDKSLVDGLFEPLLHLLRNAADHGIEPAADRSKAGKPPRGSISLSARRVADQVVIDITDDGKGIDPAQIRQTARARALMPDEALAALSDQETIDLIFTPGFSTAETVTDLSGRGVGMDSVRTAALRLGGRIALSSVPGSGTSVRLALPVSVVLSNVIVVACAGEQYGVPMDAVVETIRIPPDRVVPVRNGRAFVLRDTVVPLLDLSILLGLGLDQAAPGADLRLLVIRRTNGLVAVVVDEFTDRLNLLLRPMSGLLTGTPGLAGTAVLGDGRVLMVLDLPELIA